MWLPIIKLVQLIHNAFILLKQGIIVLLSFFGKQIVYIPITAVEEMQIL